MENNLKPNEYVCEICRGIFEKGWTEEECIAELRKNFNEPAKEDDAILCDDCYKQFVAKIFN